MNQPIGALDKRLLIHKVVQGDGRVERHEIPKFRATTVGRLQHVSDFFHPIERVRFFKPCDGAVPFGEFQRFQLHRVIKTAKENRLPGAFPGDAHGGNMTDKFAVKAQFVKGKDHLAVNRIAQGVGGLTEYDRVASLVPRLNHNQRDSKADKGRFQRTAPALEEILRVPMIENIIQQFVIVRRDDIFDVNIRHRAPPPHRQGS